MNLTETCLNCGRRRDGIVVEFKWDQPRRWRCPDCGQVQTLPVTVPDGVTP